MNASRAKSNRNAAVPRLRPQDDVGRRLDELEASITRAQAALDEWTQGASLLCGSSPRMNGVKR